MDADTVCWDRPYVETNFFFLVFFTSLWIRFSTKTFFSLVLFHYLTKYITHKHVLNLTYILLLILMLKALFHFKTQHISTCQAQLEYSILTRLKPPLFCLQKKMHLLNGIFLHLIHATFLTKSVAPKFSSYLSRWLLIFEFQLPRPMLSPALATDKK